MPCREEKPPREGVGPSSQGLGGLGLVARALPMRTCTSGLEQQHTYALEGSELDRLVRGAIESVCASPERASEPHFKVVGEAVGFSVSVEESLSAGLGCCLLRCWWTASCGWKRVVWGLPLSKLWCPHCSPLPLLSQWP